MDVIPRIIWRVELHDPIDFGDIQASCCDVGAEQDAGFGVAEFEERVGSFLLLLLSLIETTEESPHVHANGSKRSVNGAWV